jgi:predicted DNA-binding transcriptional regulator AlpA
MNEIKEDKRLKAATPKSQGPSPDYFVPIEFADLIRLSEKSLYRLMKNDPTFPYVRIGGSIRIPRERALKWLAKRIGEKKTSRQEEP